VEEHLSGRRTRTGAVWCLLMFELWHRNFLEARGYNPQPEGMPFLCPAEGRPASSSRSGTKQETVVGGRA
jgi:hypothetical protein